MATKLSVRKGWFLTPEARSAFPGILSTQGAIVFDEPTGKTVRVRVANRVATIERLDPREDAVPIDLLSVKQAFLTRGRRVTINASASASAVGADNADGVHFDPTCIQANAHVPNDYGFDEESDNEPPGEPDAPGDEAPGEPEDRDEDRDEAPGDEDRDEPPRDETGSSEYAAVRALHARLLCVGSVVPGLLARVASTAFSVVREEDASLIGPLYLQCLQSALASSAHARRLYTEQCEFVQPAVQNNTEILKPFHG